MSNLAQSAPPFVASGALNHRRRHRYVGRQSNTFNWTVRRPL